MKKTIQVTIKLESAYVQKDIEYEEIEYINDGLHTCHIHMVDGTVHYVMCDYKAVKKLINEAQKE